MLGRSAKDMQLYEVVKDREPFFTGWETESAIFDTRCPHCKANIQIKFKEMLDAAWGWQDRLNPRLLKPLASVFNINLSNRSIVNGMPGVVASECLDCGICSFFYFNFRETSHSVYSISLRGAATEKPIQ